jgi:hypothetical protein
MRGFGYLDDPDHEYEMEPSSYSHTDRDVRGEIAQRMHDRLVTDEHWTLIVVGAARLLEKGVTKDVWKALDTSMVWCFG